MPASAETGIGARAELPPYLQCVPYARELSGIQIYGDAHTWWKKAEGRYQRGRSPRVGAVMAFIPHRKMRLGHVAAVSRVIDSRTVLLNHSNWSPVNGRRGQVERDVKAVDVSPDNDWSRVRVWYHPLQALGKTAWPVHGFIYGKKAKLSPTRLAPTRLAIAPRLVSSNPSRAFMNAFADLDTPAVRTRTAPAPKPRAAQPSRGKVTAASPRQHDAIDAAISLYD